MSRRALAWIIWSLAGRQGGLITFKAVLDTLSLSTGALPGQRLATIGLGAVSELVFPAVGALICWRWPATHSAGYTAYLPVRSIRGVAMNIASPTMHARSLRYSDEETD